MPSISESYITDLERDGFIVVQDFFDAELVRKAHDEIDAWYRRDLVERRSRKLTEALNDGVAGKTILTKPTHLMLDAYGRSPTLDALFEKILTDPESTRLLGALAGLNLKLRGYNIKRMTKNPDPRPTLGPSPIPHEWHTDSPFEICIAIYLDDFSQPDNGTTALMKGSHLFPFCPRWNCLFGPIVPTKTKTGIVQGLTAFLRFNFFNRLLAKRLRARETGAYGKRGDFYIFINDMWHGREPNIHGNDHMMLMVGAFPTEAPFPDSVPTPSAEILDRLPPRLRAAAAQSLPGNSGRDTILHRMFQHRAKARFPDLFYLARLERLVADASTAASLWFKRRFV